MSFLHLWAIGIGGAALAAPLLVHFLTRPRPVPFALSTVRFLREVIEQRRSRSRFRDWLILLLRSLCVALLALGLSRPLLRQPPVVPLKATGDTARVLIVDVSQSMGAGTAGVTAWAEAQANALIYLDAGGGTRANVIFAGARARPVFDTVSPNLPALREALRQTRPRAERTDPQVAMELAGEMLAQSDAAVKELVIISDFQRTGWATLPVDRIPADVKIQLQSVAQPGLENVAIVGVRFAIEPTVNQPVDLEVELFNDSPNDVDVRCAIELSGLRRMVETKLRARSTQTITETVTFDQAGWQHGWARLENGFDSLAADDQRPLAVRVRPPQQTLIVTRQPENLIPSSTYYIARALSFVFTPAGTDEKNVQRVNPQQMGSKSWPVADVIVIDHPGSISDDSLRDLASQVRRGRGILYVASELVDGSNLDRLAEILGSDFQPPVTLHPVPDGVERKDLAVRKLQSRQPPLDVLGDAGGNPLRAVRFGGGLATRVTSEGLRDQVLAELSDTSALLYVTGVGAGQLAVLNTDLGRSNWPVDATFLPVLSELMRTLRAGRGRGEPAATGEPMVRVLDSALTSGDDLVASTIDGEPPSDEGYGAWEWTAGRGAVVWNWPEPAGAGIYQLANAGQPEWMVATCAPPQESELGVLDEEILTTRLSGNRELGYRSASSLDEASDKTWSWLIVGCLLGLIAEVVALRVSRM